MNGEWVPYIHGGNNFSSATTGLQYHIGFEDGFYKLAYNMKYYDAPNVVNVGFIDYQNPYDHVSYDDLKSHLNSQINNWWFNFVVPCGSACGYEPEPDLQEPPWIFVEPRFYWRHTSAWHADQDPPPPVGYENEVKCGENGAPQYVYDLDAVEAAMHACNEEPDPGNNGDGGNGPPQNTEGLAQESTQLEVRDLLEEGLHADTVQPGQIDVGDFTGELPEITGGSTDMLDGRPQFLQGLAQSISNSYGQLLTTASGKIPFGLGSWIPVLGFGGPSADCSDIQITLLGTTRGVGWCDSMLYNAITTVGRGAVLVGVLIAFALASARTIAWA